MIQDEQASLNKIDLRQIVIGISKITDIYFKSLNIVKPRNLSDNQGVGI